MTAVQRQEYPGLDYFRLAAAFLVVAIHTSPLTSLSTTADFTLTRILARIAVPFFFMASGFLLYSGTEGGRLPFRSLIRFVRRTGFLYGIAILLYLPLNLYSGTFETWTQLPELLKALLFNGTLYHLWYLPAVMEGACVVWLLLRILNRNQAFVICLTCYMVGLFGDSYYGISERIPFMKAVYQYFFLIFDYTRNGLFFAPAFFLLGALLVGTEYHLKRKICLPGLALSLVFMLAEGLLLHTRNLQRHDSMYVMLLPCMFFLFQCLLLWNGESCKCLRNLSMIIYLIHPAVIVAVRGFAKETGLQGLLLDNSMMYYLAVSLGSSAAAVVVVRLNAVTPDRLKFARQKAEYKADQLPALTDRAWAEINLSNLRHNISVFRGTLPGKCKVMAVVKANAYGHGAVELSTYLNNIGIDSFAVAAIDEGIQLRRAGMKGEILILGYTPAARAEELSHFRLSQTVVDADHARELSRSGKPIQVHIKVDTGMNRLGESCRNVSGIASVFRCKNIIVSGIFTHLPVSDSMEDSDVAFTNRQIKNFYELLAELKAAHISIPPVHIQSSYGILNYPELQCDHVRIGIALYGVLSTPDVQSKTTLCLKPVLALKSRVVLVRTINAGETVGYGREFTAQKETKIAVISIGYADGIPRNLSTGKGCVLIGGHRAPIIGRICMDQLMADVTGISDIKRGDVVTLIGRDGSEELTAEELAAAAGTITNELLSRLSGRLERVFFY